MSAKLTNAEENSQKRDLTNSIALQVVSALAVTGFTAFMAWGWYCQLYPNKAQHNSSSPSHLKESRK